MWKKRDKETKTLREKREEEYEVVEADLRQRDEQREAEAGWEGDGETRIPGREESAYYK